MKTLFFSVLFICASSSAMADNFSFKRKLERKLAANCNEITLTMPMRAEVTILVLGNGAVRVLEISNSDSRQTAEICNIIERFTFNGKVEPGRYDFKLQVNSN